MTENEVWNFISEAKEVHFPDDIKKEWTLIAEFATEHMKIYKLYKDANRDKKFAIVSLL